MDQGKILPITYKFLFDNGTKKEFIIELDEKSLDLVIEHKGELPEWTNLSCNRCSICPLDENEHKHCPIAANISEVIEFFCKTISIEEIVIEIETPERNYKKRTAVQGVISPLIGIYMVTSGCPIMDKLRPMVRFHLPFADNDETVYRSLSMYLVSQFLLKKNGKEPDFDMVHLQDIYKDINAVNASFCQRIRSIKIEDASLNALVHLDCFAQFVQLSIEAEFYDKMNYIFKSYRS